MTGSGNFPPGRALKKPAPVAEAPEPHEKETSQADQVTHLQAATPRREGRDGMGANESAPVSPAGSDSVAEAPERVTPNADDRLLVERFLARYGEGWSSWEEDDMVGFVATLREQSEREVAKLRNASQAATALRECYERDVAALQAQLTDANIKAEGLRVDNAELKAKLAESERKLGEAERRIQEEDARAEEWKDTADQRLRNWSKLKSWLETTRAACHSEPTDEQSLHMAYAYRVAIEEMQGIESYPPASTEPAGVEAGKVDPTPTETEAPARLPTLMGNAPDWIRIGKSVRLKTSGQAPCIIDNYDTLHEWVSFKGGTGARFSWDDIEPYEMLSEAPARFRVGQRVRIGAAWHGPRSVSEVRVNALFNGGKGLIVGDGAFEWSVEADTCTLLEPADPPPPKQSCPYADCDCSGCVFCRVNHSPEARESCHCWCERRDPAPPKPGTAKLTGPVEAFRAELVAAIELFDADQGTIEDARLIAAMRNALPALLDLVEAADILRKRLHFPMLGTELTARRIELTDYDTKRAALAKALEVTDG